MVYVISRLAVSAEAIKIASRSKTFAKEVNKVKTYEILGTFDTVREASKFAAPRKGAEICRELPKVTYERDVEFNYISAGKKRIKKMC